MTRLHRCRLSGWCLETIQLERRDLDIPVVNQGDRGNCFNSLDWWLRVLKLTSFALNMMFFISQMSIPTAPR